MAYLWRENMLRYLSTDIICSWTQIVSFEEEKMPKRKYPILIMKSKGGYCDLKVLSRHARSFSKLGNISEMFPCWFIFSHMTNLDQPISNGQNI